MSTTLDVHPALLEIPDSPLKMAAKRYTFRNRDSHGLTLLFAHCVGAHKEQFEPTIQRVFEIAGEKKIREAWAFDWQSHGDSAIANEKELQGREGITIYEWASAINAFVHSPRMRGHSILPLGHSAGAGAIMLTIKEVLPLSIPYAAMILIEPTMVSRQMFYEHFEDRMETMNFTVQTTQTRRDKWDDRETAFHWLRKRFPWQMWSPRVLQLLVEHGLRDTEDGQVVLKCPREQEAASYPEVDGHFEAVEIFERVGSVFPIHLIWGTRNDLVPEDIQDALRDCNAASVRSVEDAGHFVVQESPDALAEKICGVLHTIRIPSRFSRL